MKVNLNILLLWVVKKEKTLRKWNLQWLPQPQKKKKKKAKDLIIKFKYLLQKIWDSDSVCTLTVTFTKNVMHIWYTLLFFNEFRKQKRKEKIVVL